MEASPAKDQPSRSSAEAGHRWHIVAVGCVALLGFSVCGCLALGVTSFGLLTYIAREPEGLVVEYALPTRVQRGDEFDLVLTLTNVGNTELLVSDIDLDEALSGSILDGAIVIDADPPMARDYSIPGIKSFSFGRAIPAGEARQVTFHLQAITIGEFGGSIGVYVGGSAKRITYAGITIAPE